MIDKSGPAFPQPIDDMGTLTAKTEGLSKRELFAGMAMQGLLSSSLAKVIVGDSGRKTPEVIAEAAVEMADALLKELEK